MAVDRSGSAFVTGDTISNAFPVTPGAIQALPQGADDVFVTKLDARGTLAYSTRLAGGGPDVAEGIAVDFIGDVYVTGHGSTTFPISPQAPVTVPLSSVSPFVAKLVPRVAFAVSASASSQESAVLAPAAAIDGNPATRWSSAFGDMQWLVIDLGVMTRIDRFILDWETAYARDYQVQVSEDGVRWDSTIVRREFEDGGLDDYVNFHGYGRYLRVLAVRRGTQWGSSLWEVQVFGVPAETNNTPPTLAILSPPDGAQWVAPATFDIQADASDPDGWVARVDFYVNNEYLASDNEAPFLARYTAQPGTYHLRAEAIDNAGGSPPWSSASPSSSRPNPRRTWRTGGRPLRPRSKGRPTAPGLRSMEAIPRAGRVASATRSGSPWTSGSGWRSQPSS